MGQQEKMEVGCHRTVLRKAKKLGKARGQLQNVRSMGNLDLSLQG